MLDIQILFEDNHVLVAVKPPGILSQADDGEGEDMLTLLKARIKERDNKPGNVFLGLVHRLDRPAGGLMVFAKTSKAASRLSEAVRTRHFEKIYHAVVLGVPAAASARLTHWLLKNETKNTVKAVQAGTKGAKEAILDYNVIRSNGILSKIKVHLLTGRPHQIRVQCATAGFPLAGDRKYGPQSEYGKYDTAALWAVELSFPHPVKKDWMTFRSDPPKTAPWDEL